MVPQRQRDTHTAYGLDTDMFTNYYHVSISAIADRDGTCIDTDT